MLEKTSIFPGNVFFICLLQTHLVCFKFQEVHSMAFFLKNCVIHYTKDNFHSVLIWLIKEQKTENKLILVEFALNKKYISFVSNMFRLVNFKKITHTI